MKATAIPFNREELHYKFVAASKNIIRKNKDMDVNEIAALIDDAHALAVPPAAFDAIQPWDEGVLLFHGGVEESEVVELQHDLLRVHLNLDPEMPITLNMSSSGGSVYAGLALVATIGSIRRDGRKVNCNIQGTAMSMASVIAQVADHRTIEESAQIMLHKISYGMRGSTDEHEEELAAAHKLHESMFAYYTARTGKSASYYMTKLKKTNLYMSAHEALAEGLVDEVLATPPFTVPPKKRVPKR